jgi:lipocalin-like protein
MRCVQWGLAVCLLPAGAWAQTNALVGTWSIASLVEDHARGKQSQPFGEHPNGAISYGQDGTVFVFIATSDRAKSTAPAMQPVGPVVAYYGTYTLDGTNLTNHVKGSTYPNFEGTEQKGVVTVSGDHAKLVRTITGGAETFTSTLELTRVSK